MKYDETDIIDVWDKDKIDCDAFYYFGNDKEELLARANSGTAESYRYSDITGDIFYVPDFMFAHHDEKGRVSWTDDCYSYAIPVEKPFVRSISYRVSVRIELDGVIDKSTFAKSREEAERMVLDNLNRELASYGRFKYKVTTVDGRQ